LSPPRTFNHAQQKSGPPLSGHVPAIDPLLVGNNHDNPGTVPNRRVHSM
jgi:hypothetical protein